MSNSNKLKYGTLVKIAGVSGLDGYCGAIVGYSGEDPLVQLTRFPTDDDVPYSTHVIPKSCVTIVGVDSDEKQIQRALDYLNKDIEWRNNFSQQIYWKLLEAIRKHDNVGTPSDILIYPIGGPIKSGHIGTDIEEYFFGLNVTWSNSGSTESNDDSPFNLCAFRFEFEIKYEHPHCDIVCECGALLCQEGNWEGVVKINVSIPDEKLNTREVKYRTVRNVITTTMKLKENLDLSEVAGVWWEMYQRAQEKTSKIS